MVKTLLYKCLKIGEIEIFTWKSLEFFEEIAEPGLIVVGNISMILDSVKQFPSPESPLLPSGWDGRVRLRGQFEQYCEVTGLVFLPSCGATRRLLVAFPSSKVAAALVAKGNLRIGGQSVVVKPATAAAVAV